MSGAAWALVAAVAFGVTQIFNRKANQLVDAFRTAFGMLLVTEVILIIRLVITGEVALVADAPVSSVLYFAGSTLIHYVGGWTLIALSQQQIGVARSQALVGAAPVVGAVLAAFILDETLTVPVVVGVLIAVAGVWMVSMSAATDVKGVPWSNPWYALTAAALWGISPQLIRLGLQGLDSPLVGVTVGLAFTVPIHGLVLMIAKPRRIERGTSHGSPVDGAGGDCGCARRQRAVDFLRPHLGGNCYHRSATGRVGSCCSCSFCVPRAGRTGHCSPGHWCRDDAGGVGTARAGRLTRLLWFE